MLLGLQKLLHHGLLVRFLNMSLGNTGQKTCKRYLKDTPQPYKAFCFFILSFCFFILYSYCYIFFCGTNQKNNEKQNVSQNETKDLTFKISNLSITFFFYEGPNIYEILTERRWGGLEICHVLMDSIDFKEQIYGSFLKMGGWGWVRGVKN